LATEGSEADKPAKAHKTIFAPNNIYVLPFLQTFITNYLRHVKKPGSLLYSRSSAEIITSGTLVSSLDAMTMK
jgi:hypothetical protein